MEVLILVMPNSRAERVASEILNFCIGQKYEARYETIGYPLYTTTPSVVVVVTEHSDDQFLSQEIVRQMNSMTHALHEYEYE